MHPKPQPVEPLQPQLVNRPSRLAVHLYRYPPPPIFSDVRGRTPQFKGRALKSWREVIHPHPDVQNGDFQEAEFAADLQSVFSGEARSPEYADPELFFARTFVTPGLRSLLVSTLRRINGTGGAPVIQMQTGFGGGKTHSLIAILHLIRAHRQILNSKTSSADDLRSIFTEAGADTETGVEASIAVLHGTYISPTSNRKTDRGNPLNTIWAEMAYQLGGEDGYQFIHQAAIDGAAPVGEQLDALFKHVGPSVILIDELVAYIRNVPSERQGSIFTFLQALTESATRIGNVALVVTLPQSRDEAGGDEGMAMLARLEQLFARIQSIWQPLEVNEAFQVVRRRLFEPEIDGTERDHTCQAFFDMYHRNRNDYPRAASEAAYLQRLKDCYPIHPEVFDRLFNDWSSIQAFQRTRGVLRMMAQCISFLSADNDTSPLIMPGDLPLRDQQLSSELGNILEGRWEPVFGEIDGTASKTFEMDRGKTDYMEVGGASRRAARTIFLGSATGGAIQGIDDRHIHLGTVMPSHGAAIYNDAVRNMSQNLYYLYFQNGRYYFHSEPNLNKLVQDRISQLDLEEIDSEIERRLKEATRRRIPIPVIVCPEDSSQVPDDSSKVKLVILSPSQYLPSRQRDTDYAIPVMRNFLARHGDNNRSYRNMLLFLATKYDDANALRKDVASYLAWQSIIDGPSKISNLASSRINEANQAKRDFSFRADNSLVRAYSNAIAPRQRTANEPDSIDFPISRINSGTGELSQDAYDQFIADEALTAEMAHSMLAIQLQQNIWSSARYRDHIGIDDLWRIFASQVYMERLQEPSVLNVALAEGVKSANFGLAERYVDGDYHELKFGEPLAETLGETRGIIVNPEMAQIVKDEQKEQESESTSTTYSELDGRGDGYSPLSRSQADSTGTDQPEHPSRTASTKVTATKTLQGQLSLDEVSMAQEEIIRNLIQDGAHVTVHIVIEAEKPDGITERIEQSVRENSAQLGFAFSASS